MVHSVPTPLGLDIIKPPESLDNLCLTPQGIIHTWCWFTAVAVHASARWVYMTRGFVFPTRFSSNELWLLLHPPIRVLGY